MPAAIAQLVGVSPEHIAFMPATSYGLAIAAFFKGVGGFVQTPSLSPSYQALI
jgi:hypothetical protein